jgi:hypothetical protein
MLTIWPDIYKMTRASDRGPRPVQRRLSSPPHVPSRVVNRPFLITLCVIGALAFALIPSARTDASTAMLTVIRHSGSLIAPTRTPGTAATRDGTPKLSSQFRVTIQPNDVLFTLDVINEGGKKLEVTFPDGQLYDFIVRDSTGREVWRWAKGRLFTQTMRAKLLERNQSMRLSEHWTAPAAGRYTAVARLRSNNFPVEQQIEFAAR